MSVSRIFDRTNRAEVMFDDLDRVVIYKFTGFKSFDLDREMMRYENSRWLDPSYL